MGAYLLRYKQQFRFVLGFQIPGIHTLLGQGQAEVILNRLEEGLKGFRPGDRLRIHFCSFASDAERQQELKTLVKTANSLETQFLLLAQQRKTRDLTLQREWQPKQIYLFATYSIEPSGERSSDRIEKILAWFVKQYEAFKGMKERSTKKQALSHCRYRLQIQRFSHWSVQG